MSSHYLVLFSLLLSMLAGHDTHNKMHQCIHDQIDHRFVRQHVQYNNHPLHPSTLHRNRSSRNLLQSTAYQPIRIRPYYDSTSINTANVPHDKIQYIKKLISASILYLQQFIHVIPVDGPLLINRCQRIWYYNQFTYSVCPLSDYQEPAKCQYATIPNDHLSESWYYEEPSKKSYLYKPAGSGIADTDLVIYVSYSNAQCNDGNTLAFSSICNLDQYGRPVAGTINFCPGILTANYWKFDVGVTLHELLHILIMSNTLFAHFYDFDKYEFRGMNNVVLTDQSTTSLTSNAYVITDKVRQHIRKHFNCAQLIGAPLENINGANIISSHWEARYTQYELMCATIYSAVMYLSKLTLYLMEDSGWYAIDYNWGDEQFSWGQNAGCSFITGSCVDKATQTAKAPQFYCTSPNDDGCSFDYSAMADCKNSVSGSSSTAPANFQWYTDTTFGGAAELDYCAIRDPERDTTWTDYERVCWDIRGNIYSHQLRVAYPSSKFGADSRCMEVQDGVVKRGYCFVHECLEYDSLWLRYNSVAITISDGGIDTPEKMLCTRQEEFTWKTSGVYGTQFKCPNIDTICGTSRKPFACFWGHWNDHLNECICSVGYIGADCSVKDNYRVATEATVYTTLQPVVPTTTQPRFAGVCIRNSIATQINGFYAYDLEYEGLPSYVSAPEISAQATTLQPAVDPVLRYVYFLRYYSEWNVGYQKGDISVHAFCIQSPTAIDIATCQEWQVYDDVSKGWIYDTAVSVYACNPSGTPTRFPSNNPTTPPPTMRPTMNPTVRPTFYPTMRPSGFPTKSPTFNPVSSPTRNPSYAPTRYPSANPSKHPTAFPTSNPSRSPTLRPSRQPSVTPTKNPTSSPVLNPTRFPSNFPTRNPSRNPTKYPSVAPTKNPNVMPTKSPSLRPTTSPSTRPSTNPTQKPTPHPSMQPTLRPTGNPNVYVLTMNPTLAGRPTNRPTVTPAVDPTEQPTLIPNRRPSDRPTVNPSKAATNTPTSDPSQILTELPSKRGSVSPPTSYPTDSLSSSPTTVQSDGIASVMDAEQEQQISAGSQPWFVAIFAFIGACLCTNIALVGAWFGRMKSKYVQQATMNQINSASNKSMIMSGTLNEEEALRIVSADEMEDHNLAKFNL